MKSRNKRGPKMDESVSYTWHLNGRSKILLTKYFVDIFIK